MERDETKKKEDLARIDAFIKFLEEAISEGLEFDKFNLDALQLLRALVMNPPQEIVESGYLEELESLAAKVGKVFLLLHIDINTVRKKPTKFNLHFIEVLQPMRDWRMLYSVLPDKISVKQDTTEYDQLLKKLIESRYISYLLWDKDPVEELAILREGINDFPKLLIEDCIFFTRKIRSFIDQTKERKKIRSITDLDELDGDFFNFVSEASTTLRSEGYVHLFDYYRAEVDKLKPSEIYIPSTPQLGIVDHLVQNLEELVKAKADSLGPLKPYILQLQEMLTKLLQLLSIRVMEDEEYALIDMTALARWSYEAEIAIDSFLIGDVRTWFCMIWLHDILKKLKSKMQQVSQESGDPQFLLSSIRKSPSNVLQVYPIFVNNTSTNENLWEIFTDRDIYYRFDIRTWCLVSSYRERKKEVLCELLGNALHKGWHAILVITPSVELALACRYGSPEFGYNMKSSKDSSLSQNNTLTTDDDVVGFKEELERMLLQLTGEPTQLHIISIVGMGGQGKTTFAKKLYSHDLIVDYFYVRAWCSVSQVYEKRKLLLELLSQITPPSESIHHKNDVELAQTLCNSLRGQRFLIILDDIWSIEVWEDLKRCFPDNNNGSRIIFTTRLQSLASQAQSSSMLQPLGLLSNEESLELLRKKLFQNESCPPELLGVATQIAKRCKGLPISIVLTAGLLVKMEKKEDQWKKIAESLSSHILGDAEELGKGVIEMSYNHLPDHLKSCFLYFGAFLEDKEVSVSKLIRLWVAEGFIKHTGMESLEDVAEEYLMDLINRSLVTVAQEKANNMIKSCLVHDLLREFCLTKSREENFLELIHGYDEHFSSSMNDVDYGIDPNYNCTSKPNKYFLHRLCIYSKRSHFIMLKPFGQFVRSLLFFAANDMCPNYAYDISFISHNFKLLRILDLEDINIGDSFKAIEVLVHLRYLAVQGYVDFVPSSMANLWNLETFLVRGLRAKVVKVSDSIWNMTKLRHIHINDTASFDLDLHRFENSSILENLQTFSTPSLSYGDDMEKIMRRIPGLRKLKCIFIDSWDDNKNCNQFPNLEFLIKLESLKVLYNGEGKYPCKFSFSTNLKKLTLSNFHMSHNEISQLAMLHKLEVLKLRENTFEGEIWEMEDDVVFPKLKFLKLDTMNIVKWSVSCENFPNLERLLLHKCDQLVEIPQEIGDLSSLEMIEVMWCSPSTATSARIIQDEQLDYGKEIKVHVHPKVWDSESSSSSE